MSGFSLYVEGEQYQKNDVNLFTSGKEYAYTDPPGLQLFIRHELVEDSGIMGLYASGDNVSYGAMILHSFNTTSFTPSDPDNQDIPENISLYVRGAEGVIQKDDNPFLDLYIKSFDVQSSGNIGLYIDPSPLPPTIDSENSSMTLAISSFPISLFETDSSMRLYIDGKLENVPVLSSMPLYLQNFPSSLPSSGSFTLFISDDNTLRWDSDYPGVNIGPEDEPYTSVASTDPIRGLELICYGNCAIGTCEDVSIETHDTQWFEPLCVDGGIFRANDVYTDLEENAFGGELPYSGHFYGMRKITGLHPFERYVVTVTGRSGSSIKVPAPKELATWEYTTEGNEVGYSGTKLIGDSPYLDGIRNSGDKYGTSVDMNGDLVAVGSPFADIVDSEGNTLNDAGTVMLYRRGPEPDNDLIIEEKAPWNFEAVLQLPSGIVRDYYTTRPDTENGIPVTITDWRLGQEGRNFGSDVHITIIKNEDPWVLSEEKQLIAVGAPNAAWSRTFDDLTPQENEILLFVFTDEFVPEVGGATYRDILDAVVSKNLLYQYYSNPNISLSIKIVIFQPIDFDLQANIDFPPAKPSFIKKRAITRHRNEPINSTEFSEIDDELFDQIKDAFEELYPPGAASLPAILGVYVDNSRSLGNAAIEPALSRFKDYYQDYTFNNGLTDYAGAQASGAVLSTTSIDENWIAQTKSLINFTLDSGRLVSEDYLQLLTNPATFPNFASTLDQFNMPPSSGGCVYLFEKEGLHWNLIQQIDSPNNDNTIAPDLFGKCVDISESGNILAIGSPYINEAVTIYEFDHKEKDRMYSNIENWVDYHLEQDPLSEYYGTIKSNIITLKEEEGFIDGEDVIPSSVFRTIFFNFSHQEKYDYRHDKEYWIEHKKQDVIKEYKQTFVYKYDDIPYTGTYLKLIEQFAPTSRMGYSLAVNDDGSSIAIGCPTDSLDVNDDTNTYYHPTNSGQILWPSYVNAGAVRTINSINYTKHDSVVEYGKFGNKYATLYQGANPEYFNHFEEVYSGIQKNFVRQDYSDFSIPDNAGTIFIICPEVDFSNITVMRNLRRWLDLGDRNLVLVGNDSVNEEYGQFRKCNTIINNILTKLDSSMRLFDVNDSARSIFKPNNTCADKPNVLKSSRPENSIDTYIKVDDALSGNGAADIRVGISGLYEDYQCSEAYIQNNSYCSPFLEYGGDLRTQWTDENGVHNWPNLFNKVFGSERQAPVPLLSSAYYKPSITVTIPEIPARSGLRTFYDVEPDFSGANFGSPKNNTIQFGWSEEYNLDLYNQINYNVGLNSNNGRFFNPTSRMSIDTALQARASDGVDVVLGFKEVARPCHFAAQENIPNSSHKVFLISSLAMETVDVLYSGLGDKDINFYFNIVAKDGNGSSYIAQINSFTGRSDFTDAKPNSILELVFKNTGNTVSTNVDLNQLVSGHPNGSRYNVCWIANPLNAPSDDDIEILDKWLENNNKKIVITYDNETAAKNAEILCDKLGVSMKPLYLPNKSRFANNVADIHPDDSRNFYRNTRFPTNPIINPLNTAIRYGFVPSRDAIASIGIDCATSRFIPVQLNNALSIASINHGIVDDQLVDVGYHYFHTGTAKLTVPVEPNTAYKIFFTTAAFSDYEKEKINVYITNCSSVPSFSSPAVPPSQNIFNKDSNNNDVSVFNGPVGIIGSIGGTQQNSLLQTYSFNFQTLDDVNEVSVFFENSERASKTYDARPSTVSLLAVSGCLLNLSPSSRLVPRYEWVITQEAQPAITSTVDFPNPFPFESSSDKYCPDESECQSVLGSSTIEDGPVLAAQEIYPTTSLQGINKSRITLISDVSLIEGPCVLDEDGDVKVSHERFLQSFYPDTVFPETDANRLFRKESVRKIVAPERSSPARLFQGVGKSGLMERFIPDNSNVVNSGLSLLEFKDTVDLQDVDRPTLLDSDLQSVISAFKESQVYYGSNSITNYDFNGSYHKDVSIYGGKPDVIDLYGGDFINSDIFASGYPGDLFGYSVDYHRGKLVVGSPFAAYYNEDVVEWDTVANAHVIFEEVGSIEASRNGGAGSVYVYQEQSNRQLAFTNKLRPKSINVGQDLFSQEIFITTEDDQTLITENGNPLELTIQEQSTLNKYLGANNYSLDDLLLYSTFTDQFGYAVKIYSDVIAVGAPGHDYSINADLADSILASGAFAFKEFNYEFDAKPRVLVDLGDPEVRAAIGLISGVMNNGAVYTFEHKVINSRTKEQDWVFIEKLIPDGYNARLQQNYDEEQQVVASGTENEHFGENLALYRAKRTDADYTIAIGAPHHKFAVSSTHQSGDLEDAGAVFLFDAMLRQRPPYLADDNAFISANIFGEKHTKLSLDIDNQELDGQYQEYGIVYTNSRGELYIEASGQDSNLQGFAVHRPYIRSVYGRVYVDPDASGSQSSFNLYTNAVEGASTSDMRLYCNAANSATVYNSMITYVNGMDSEGDTRLNLYLHTPEGDPQEDWVGLFMASGIGSISDSFSLYIRGY